MEYQPLHDWDLTPEQAVSLQREMASQVRQHPLDLAAVQSVAGADLSFEAQRATAETPVYAGIVTLSFPKKQLLEQQGVRTVAPFPYIPGLLSFREAPPLLEAWKLLTTRPDVLLADGQGIAHPRRFGLACHLGLILDLPTIGVAKTLFVGKHAPVPEEVGSWTPLIDRGETVGAALRTRRGVTPIFVSVGHQIDLESALAIVLRCLTGTRLPETTRQAHQFVNRLRREDAEKHT